MILIILLAKDLFTARHIIDAIAPYYFDILVAKDHFTARHILDALAPIFLLFNSLKRAGGPFGPPALFSKTIIDALAPYCLIIIASIMHIY